MKDMTTTKQLNIKAIVAGVVPLAILAGLTAFLTVTATGRAIVFAVSDPTTVNHAADMKSDYVKHFQLSAGPKN
jgi:hypothetical protein